jgi:predicted restriction endonuclease
VLHDAAFDRGLITISDQFELRVSKRIKPNIPPSVYREMFESRDGAPIAMPERFTPLRESLEYHRREVFSP